MGVNWTDEQKKVIEKRDRNILVSAAAGSGKTAVLVERIIHRIALDDKPIDIDNILVVTFTKAAAAEMKERISAAIEEKRKLLPEDENLIRQATLINNAQISTIDSFCNYIVKNHFAEIGLDPDYRIGEEAEFKLIIEDVIDEVFEKNYAADDNEAFITLVDTYCNTKDDSDLREMVKEIYKKSASSSWPRKWIENLSKLYEIETREDFLASRLIEEIVEYSKGYLLGMRDLFLKLAEEAGNTLGAESVSQKYIADAALFDGVVDLQTYDQVKGFLTTLKYARVGFPKETDEVIKKRFQDKRKKIKDYVNKLKDEYFSIDISQALDQLKRQHPYVNELIRLTLEFLDAMGECKKTKRVYSFSDIEHFALRILVDEETGKPTDVARQFSQRFEEIMIDEYQDSNQVQEDILCAISRERDGQPNMFMVGDVKQSIYRFRLAKPDLFMGKFNTYSTAEGKYQRIDLDKNFRSRSQVLDFTNDIFYKIMAEDLGNITYDDAAALNKGATEYKEVIVDDIDVMKPELLLIDYKGEFMEEIKDEEEGEKSRVEALLIANKINDLMKNSVVTDKKTKELRKPRFSDIVILSRALSGGWGDSVAEVLRQRGIPAFVDSKNGYFAAYEVLVVLSLLRILDNPLQDIPMAAVLRSPIVGLDDCDLAEIRHNFPKESFAKAAVLSMQEALNPENNAEGNLYEFAKIYEKLKKAVPDTSIHQLIYMIFELTKFDKYAAAMPAGKTRKQNLEMLVEMAFKYEKTSFKGLFHFIRYIDTQQKYEVDYGESSSIGEKDDVVRIMTIHKSKGLEFPIVFVSSLGKGFSGGEKDHKVVIHENLGIGIHDRTLNPRTKKKSLLWNRISLQNEMEDLGEGLRILYVALTRAKEKLFLVGGLADYEKSLSQYVGNVAKGQPLSFYMRYNAKCYLDWIIPAMMSYPDKYDIDTVSTEEFIVEATKELAVADFTRELLNEKIENANKETADKIVKGFTFDYPFATDITKKSKYSVSELKRASMSEKYDGMENEAEMQQYDGNDIDKYIPSFAVSKVEKISCENENKAKEASFIDASESTEQATAVINKNGSFRGSEFGTAMHRVMQCLDFAGLRDIDTTDKKAVWKFVCEQVESLKNKALIDDETASRVNYKFLASFIESKICKRMVEADVRGELFREKPFVMEHDGVLVQGIIDVFWIEDEQIVLLDYKTDKVENMSELAERYKLQLELYGEALERIFTTKDKKAIVKERMIYSFRLGEIVDVSKTM